MWKWSIVIFAVLFVILPSVAVASVDFDEDAVFNPDRQTSGYHWQNGGSASFTDDLFLYRVTDYGTGQWLIWRKDNTSFQAAVCGQSYFSSSCILMNSTSTGDLSVPMSQPSFSSGYFVLLGKVLEVEPLPIVSVSPESGEFTDYLDVVISGSSGSTLYYSLDGSEPSLPYTGTIRITDSITVRAKAVNSAGSSPVVSKSYTKKVVALSLIISPDTSVLDKPLQVSLIPSEPGGTVYYSLDGSEPSRPYTGAITVDRPLTLKAKFVKDGRSSPVYQKVYKKAPIMRSDEKFFQVPVDLPAVVKGATDYISVASPGVWLFAVSFLGLLILGIVKKVFRK